MNSKIKRYIFTIVLATIHFALFVQKKPLDFSTPATWPFIDNGSIGISNDGKYVIYTISSLKTEPVLTVQATDRTWKKQIPGINEGIFTQDSRKLIFRKPGDTLSIMDLEKDTVCYIEKVGSFKTPTLGDGRWIAYQMKNLTKDMVLLNLLTWKKKDFQNVEDYEFSNNGKVLLIQTNDEKGNIKDSSLTWLNLEDGNKKIIGNGFSASCFSFDETASELVFLAKEHVNDKMITTLQYFKESMDSSVSLVQPSTIGMEGAVLSKNESAFFNKIGDNIFFYIEDIRQINSVPSDAEAHVEIQNYHDNLHYSRKPKGEPSLAVFHLGNNSKVIRLQHADDYGVYKFNEKGNGDNIVFENIIPDDEIKNKWNISKRYAVSCNIYLISTRDGSRKLIKQGVICENLSFSIAGKYLVWFDEEQGNWFSYNIEEAITKNITKNIGVPMTLENDIPHHSGSPFNIAGWLENDVALLIYDRYDIWQVDPEGSKPPVNITHGFGLKNQIQLRNMDFNVAHQVPIKQKDTLLLSAFDLITKWNGFFKLTLNGRGHLEKLIMGPKTVYFPYRYSPSFESPDYFEPVFPLKARIAGVYVLRQMSAILYPNLYITFNFKDFKPLTRLEPQKKYNWYTNALVHWKLPTGRRAEGILYKPENFDPKKKYPILFYYYEKSADGLNVYLNPNWCNGDINIPLFVSNGYLVFVPDIEYKDGHPGRSAYNSVVSAAQYLSKIPWVDTKHMGLQGHSFGGFETNYIVSHTSLFAAAVSAAGLSDLIIDYGYAERFYENGQGRIGATLWQRPDLYIANSAIFKADKVTTPLLLMHNRKDRLVRFSQGEEWYNDLSRLHKRVWMLSYEGEGHKIDKEKNQIDYSIRLTQFFNYYLKGTPSPKWMTEGGASLDLDTNGIQP